MEANVWNRPADNSTADMNSDEAIILSYYQWIPYVLIIQVHIHDYQRSKNTYYNKLFDFHHN